MYSVHINTFCVKVKNKLCVKNTIVMRLISWIHTRGSETTEVKLFWWNSVMKEFRGYLSAEPI
jgi:hypothetical protein